MKVDELISKAKDSITVKRVYGEPYVQDGLTVIPAALVAGGEAGARATTSPAVTARAAAASA